MQATASPGARSISRTPWVLRPWTEISSTGVRSITPSWEATATSSPPRTTRAAATGPVRSLTL